MAKTVIFLAAALTVLPMLGLSAVLLYYVYHYQTAPDQPDFSIREPGNSTLSDVILIDYSATSLILIASWSSSAALAFVGSFMSLFSFQAAKFMVDMSESGIVKKLPSPSQMAHIVGLLDAQKIELWTWMKHLGWRSSNRNQQNSLASKCVIYFVGALAISCFILLADTWLHLATKTVSIFRYKPVTGTDLGFSPSWDLIGSCPLNITPVPLTSDGGTSKVTRASTDLRAFAPCSLQDDAFGSANFTLAPVLTAVLSENGTDQSGNASAPRLSQGISSASLASDGEGPKTVHYQSFSFLNISSNEQLKQDIVQQRTSAVDYLASTLGVASNCSDVTPTCNLQLLSSNSVTPAFSFACPNGFSRENISDPFVLAYFLNASSSEIAGVFAHDNPLSLTLFIRQEPSSAELYSAIISCEITVYSVTNSLSSGVESNYQDGFPSSIIAQPSDWNIANVVLGPFVAGFVSQRLSKLLRAAASNVLILPNSTSSTSDLPSTPTSSNSPTGSVDFVSQSVPSSLTSLGLQVLSPFVMSSPAVQARYRTTELVTQMPRTQLTLLITANLVYACCGFLLTIQAAWIALVGKRKDEICSVQKLLTTSGALEKAFEGKKESGAKNRTEKVGVMRLKDKAKEGWRFKTFKVGEAELIEVEEEEVAEQGGEDSHSGHANQPVGTNTTAFTDKTPTPSVREARALREGPPTLPPLGTLAALPDDFQPFISHNHQPDAAVEPLLPVRLEPIQRAGQIRRKPIGEGKKSI